MPPMPLNSIRRFLQLESSGGFLLVLAGALAMILANSPLADHYEGLLDFPLALQAGPLTLAKPLLLWINDGLMAVFFLLIGLEVKREVLEGELADRARIALPAFGAIGGMLVPAFIYVGFNWDDPTGLRGWAIPSATDIAFALGVLQLLGNRVPVGLKVFLLTLAIMDDLGAIVIIAIFYTSDLSMLSLLLAGFAVVILAALNLRNVSRVTFYILVGLMLWFCVLKSGVHATLAGVATALAIPMRDAGNRDRSPVRDIEHRLHPWVAFGILPVFAFANAGVSLAGLTPATLLDPVPLGIALGLFIGKQLGVFVFAWLAAVLGLARLPVGVTWRQLYGAAILCGIGFTMSLFIGSLAFEQAAAGQEVNDRLGILVGSLLSAVVGYFFLKASLRAP
ncbi:MAG: Na+/H+ antiporter NhaA, partial [Pseudomonadota bacterium]